MGKALKAVGTAIMIVGAVVATGGAALIPALAGGGLAGALGTAVTLGGFSMSAGALLSVGSLVSSVGGSLSQPRVSNAGGALGWVGDPNGPMHFAAGRIAVGGDLRHKAAYGPNDRMFFSAVTVVSDAGPIDAFESFTANDVPVTFGADGKANSSYYGGKLWRRTQRGFQPEASYLASPSGLEGGATLPNWGPQHKLSAKAATILTMVENSKGSAYKGQQPRPREVIRGLLVYDWRRDSTYPGGSGPQRLNEPSTWAYSANPILWSVKWLLGLWEGPTGKGAPQVDYQVGGIGTRWENIDVPAFTEAANIADTHGWTCAAWPSTDDDKAQVLDAFLQAGGAYYIERAGKASCIHRAAPRVSVATITAADTAGPIELDTSASYLDRKNTGIATYLSEADGWKMTALSEVSSPQWVSEDGGRQRTVPVTYNYVDKAKQAAELICLGLAHTREGISGRIPLKSYMQGIGPGSAFTITEPEFVLDGLKCLCLETSYDANTGVHTVTFVSETDAKYPYAYGQSPNPPAPPALTPVDPTHVSPPLPGDWTIVPRPPAPGGGQLPGFDLSGIVSNETATAVIVEYGPTATGPWTQAYQGPPTVTNIPIDGVQPGEAYYIAVQYQRDQNYSERYIYGPYTAPDLIAGGITDGAAQKLLDDALKGVDDKVKEAAEEIEKAINLDDVFNGQGDLAEAILKLGRGQSELQRIIETHTREGGVLVKSIVKVMGGELENAQGAIVEEARLSLERDRAEALLREALALQVDQNEIVFQSSISGLVTDLAVEVRARQDLGARVANAEGAIVNEETIRANQDGVWLQNFNLLGARRGNGSGWVLNKSTVDITDEGTLAQVLSGLRAVDGANSSSITALSQASANQASQLLTLSNTVGGQTASISQLFQVMEGIGARWTVALDSNGTSTGLVADGQTRSWVFSGASLSIIDAGNGLSYVPATGRLKIVRGTRKTVLGAGSNLILWAGSTSIADGAETVDNGDLGIGAGDSWFGGRTLSGPFDSGVQTAGVSLNKTAWVDLAVASTQVRGGYVLSWPSFTFAGQGTVVNPSDPPSEQIAMLNISWRIATTNGSGGDVEVIESGTSGGTGRGSSGVNGVFNVTRGPFEAKPSIKTGVRRLVLQAMIGTNGSVASLTNRRLSGFYAA